MSIRKYIDTDCAAVIELWHAASKVATPFLSDEFLAFEREEINRVYLPSAETWVFETEGTVQGFVSLIGNEVGAIFVHSTSQGHGIGRALMDHAASLRDYLYLDVFEENAVGRCFYERYGFQFDRKHVHEQTGHMQIRLDYRPKSTPPAPNV